MTEETGAQHAELPSESGKRLKASPRKVNPHSGSIEQTKLRNDIAWHMRNEMLVCKVDAFLETLAPFSPDAQWVDDAYDHLKKERLLGTPAETALPVEEPERRSTRNSQKAGLVAEAEDTEHGVDAQNADIVQWELYRDTEPQKMDGTEMRVFKHLENIVKAIQGCPDPNPNRKEKRKSDGYCYEDCSGVEMKSEIPGANFRVDAVIRNPKIYKGKGKVIPLGAAQTAVVMEFKKANTPEIVYENRKQLVAAANHIMNDDPRRNWMYGITIENTDMSLWYFSRSYSMKSAPFNFTRDFKTFIHVFLSFLYANDEELGHDPSISRVYYNEKWCYVYKLETEAGPKFYRTVESLYTSRSLCITGRKSRVWKVIEVAGPNDLAPKLGECERVLKDCWVDRDSLSEKEIQGKIFDQLRNVKEGDYAWAPSGLRDRLKAGLAHPERYFMKVLWDSKEGLNKEKPKSKPKPNLLSAPVKNPVAVQGKVIPSTQTSLSTVYPSPHTSNAPASASIDESPTLRDYKVKQHYRVVYADVGKSLAHAESLSDAVRAFEDTFVALTLLFLSGWVHRDVSEGNIILVHGQNGVEAKLSDLEYARFFSQDDAAVSTDPKTGTPYFMPIEIHNGRYIFHKFKAPARASIMKSDDIQDSQRTGLTTPPVRHNFAHDLESLWWIIVWILLVRIEGVKWIIKGVFVVLAKPSDSRQDFFIDGSTLHTRPKPLMRKALLGCRADRFLAVYNTSLCEFYQDGERQDPTSYQAIYSTVWDVMEIFIGKVSGISMELKDPTEYTLRSPSPSIDPEENGKRMRPGDSVSDREDGSSRKRQKSGGEVHIDTDREHEEAVRDMAGIIREDSNPRIRTTWD